MKIKPVAKGGGVRVELGPQEAQLPSTAPETTTPVTPVFQLKQILVPVDFTEGMVKALAYAVPFAKQFDATLTLLHVVEPTFVPAAEMGALEDLDTSVEARKELEKLHAQLTDQVQCRILMRHGRAETEIINVARELTSDLIILSTHGRTGMERLLLGSTAEKVVRRAGCPIFIVRPHERDFITNDPSDWKEAGTNGESEYEETMKASL